MIKFEVTFWANLILIDIVNYVFSKVFTQAAITTFLVKVFRLDFSFFSFSFT
jgi:hypothetical protein